jgi:hypothetical protein
MTKNDGMGFGRGFLHFVIVTEMLMGAGLAMTKNDGMGFDRSCLHFVIVADADIR